MEDEDKTIGDWDFKTWDGKFDAIVYGPGNKSIEVIDGQACFEHDVRSDGWGGGYNTVQLYVPLEVLAEFLRRNGYRVERARAMAPQGEGS